MKTLKISGGIVLVLVLLFLGMTFPKSNPVVNQILGADAGPESTNDYSCNAGLCTYYRKARLNTGTSTTCVLKSPSATTSLVSAALYGNRTGSAGATTIDFTLSTLATATSSNKLGTTATWANAGQVQFYHGSTTAVVAPNTYDIGRLSTSTLSTAWDGIGSCNAVFMDAQ